MSDGTEARFVLRVPVDLHERVKVVAAENNRSMNQQIVDWLESAVDEQDPAALAARVEALEAQVAAMQRSQERQPA